MFQFGGLRAVFVGLSPQKSPWRQDCP